MTLVLGEFIQSQKGVKFIKIINFNKMLFLNKYLKRKKRLYNIC